MVLEKTPFLSKFNIHGVRISRTVLPHPHNNVSTRTFSISHDIYIHTLSTIIRSIFKPLYLDSYKERLSVFAFERELRFQQKILLAQTDTMASVTGQVS